MTTTQHQMAQFVVGDLRTHAQVVKAFADKKSPMDGAVFYFHAFFVSSDMSAKICPDIGGQPSEYPELE